jgi:hypothetical protein
MDVEQLIHQLTAALIDAYQALGVQEQEGPLGDTISQALDAAKVYLYAQEYAAQLLLGTRLARHP